MGGQDAGHAHALRENLPDLPAILVNRRTMRVIDGMHRLSAARLAGAGTIRAEFIDTDERTAFLLAVRANTRRGLPLSLADREAAAERILSWYPYWSDRSIAAIAGLAATTVGATARAFNRGDWQLNRGSAVTAGSAGERPGRAAPGQRDHRGPARHPAARGGETGRDIAGHGARRTGADAPRTR